MKTINKKEDCNVCDSYTNQKDCEACDGTKVIDIEENSTKMSINKKECERCYDSNETTYYKAEQLNVCSDCEDSLRRGTRL